MRILPLISRFLLLGICSASFATPSGRYNLITSMTYPGGNLLSNGGFENNYSGFAFEGWQESVGYPADIDAFKPIASNDATKPFNGRQMAAIQFKVPANLIRFLVASPFPVKPNTWYTFFLKYRTSGYAPASEADTIRPIFQTFKSKDISPQSEAEEEEVLSGGFRNGAGYLPQTGWTTYVHRFQTGSLANYGVISLLWGGTPGTSGTFYFDDAYMAEGCVKSTGSEILPSGCPTGDVQTSFATDPRNPDFKAISRQFLDGNNKPIQKIVQDGNRDIVTQTIYDDFGRVQKTTLPIADDMGDNAHNFIPDILADGSTSDKLAQYYHPSEFGPVLDDLLVGRSEESQYPQANGVAYSENVYENSPLGRIVESGGPGSAWAVGSAHTTHFLFSSVTDLADLDNLPPATGEGGHFFVQEVTYPDGNISREYKDMAGKVVRKSSRLRILGVNHWVHTDYQFDGRGNVSQVMAPGTDSRLTSKITYNPLNLMVSDSTPESGISRFQYDAVGRLRFSQSAMQQVANTFSFVRYDALGRSVLSGEILDGGLFGEDKAMLPEFPCPRNCQDQNAFLPLTSFKIRSVNQYDREDSSMDCMGNRTTGPIGNAEGMFFLAVKPTGESVTSGYEIYEVYQKATSALQGQSGNFSILAIGDAGSLVTPPPEVELVLDNGGLDFSLEFVLVTSPEGIAAKAAFQAQEAKQLVAILGPPEFMEGRLAKSLSCNYELAQDLGVGAPKEVSKTFRYDKYGNATRVLEINGYVHYQDRRGQLALFQYDTLNRLSKKTVCQGTDCSSLSVHVETYQYDALGRLERVLDKAGNTITQNHYNRIGQLSARGMGGDLVASNTSNAIVNTMDYHLHGLPVRIANAKIKDGSSMFQEDLTYENGESPRFDGDISSAAFAYPANSSSLNNIKFDYIYDDLGRLSDAYATPFSSGKGTAYDYLDDGRLVYMEREGRHGDYAYDDHGRLKEIAGNLVQNRDMSAPTAGGSVFTYDQNGNLVTDQSKGAPGHPMIFSYRSDNLPYKIRYRLPGSTAEHTLYLAYNEAGQRVTKEEVVDGEWQSSKNYFGTSKEIRERDGVVPVEIHGLADAGRVSYADKSEGAKEFYLGDHLGSTRIVYSLDSGRAVHATHYFPYGKEFGTLATSGEPITEKFTGKELDDGIDLSYFGARYYDADIGLWISPDRAHQFFSAYSYGEPINGIDPDGLARYQFYVYMKDYELGNHTGINKSVKTLEPGLSTMKQRMTAKYGDFEMKVGHNSADLLSFIQNGKYTAVVSHSDINAPVITPTVKKPYLGWILFKDLNTMTPEDGETFVSACGAGTTLDTYRLRYPNLEGKSTSLDDLSLLFKEAEGWLDEKKAGESSATGK